MYCFCGGEETLNKCFPLSYFNWQQPTQDAEDESTLAVLHNYGPDLL